MTITYHHEKSPFDQIDALAYGFAYRVFSAFKQIKGSQVLVAWIVGLILLVTVGLVYTVLFYVPLLLVRKRMKKEINSLLPNVPALGNRDAIVARRH